MKINDYLSKAIKWNATGDAEFPYSAMVDGKNARIRVNDFPADNLYTLIVGTAECDVDDWPSVWAKTTNKKATKSNGLPHGRLIKAI